MMTIFEEIEYRRCRDLHMASIIGMILAGLASFICGGIVLCGGPHWFASLAIFEAFVTVVFFALWRRARRRMRKLEEFR